MGQQLPARPVALVPSHSAPSPSPPPAPRASAGVLSFFPSGAGRIAATPWSLFLFSLGLFFSFLISYATRLPSQALVLVWLPVGWALAAFLLTRDRDWWILFPILIATDVFVNLAFTHPGYAWYWAVAYAVVNLSEPALIAFALRRILGRNLDLFTPYSLSGLILIAVSLGPALAAIPGAALVIYLRPGTTYLAEWQKWWVGDALGVLLVTPLLLSWCGDSWKRPLVPPGRRVEAVLLIVALVVVGQLALGRPANPITSVLDVPHIVIPFLLWAALRFGRRIFTLALAILGAQLIWEVILGGGPFNANGRSPHEVVLASQVFLAISAASTLFLSAYVVTHRRLDSVRQSFDHFASLLPDVLWVYSRKAGRFLYLNPAYERFTGQSVGTGVADPEAWLKVVHPDDRERVSAIWSRRDSMEGLDAANLEFRLRDPSGQVRWIWAHWTEELDPQMGERVLVGSDRDITAERQLELEQRRLEEELHAAKRFEAIGMVSAGVAHDLKNVIQLVISHADLLSESLPPDSEAASSARDLASAAEQVNRLSRSLLSMGRPQGNQGPCELVEAVADAADLIQRMLPREIAFQVSIPEVAVHVALTGDEVHQILLNLVLNARDAISGSGLISVRLDTDGEVARLEVADNGSGVAPEIRDRLFRAFATTKPDSGTGLGLATVQRLARAGGGTVSASSILGQGSRFTVELRVLIPR